MAFSRFSIKSLLSDSTTLESGTTAATRITESAPITSVRTAAPSTVFVELGEAAQKAQIARDGIGIAPIALNTDALQNLIVGRPQLVTKVVSQSVAPGTAVPRGTTVDIVLAQPGVLPIDVIRDPHIALSGRTLSNVYETFIRESPDVRNVLARNESADTLSVADRAVIQQAFQSQELPIDNTPGQTIDQAFGSLQAAFTFGT
jgi:hypothetical protein